MNRVVFLVFILVEVIFGQCPTKGRLLMSDFRNPAVHVLELDNATPQIIQTFAVTGSRASLYQTKSAAYGAVVQRGNHTVHFISSGITTANSQVTKNPPSLLNYVAYGPQPTHFVSNKGKIAIFFDGFPGSNQTSGTVVITESTLTSPTPEVFNLTDLLTHHGVSVPADDNHYIVSIKNPVSEVSPSLPDGFLIYNNSQSVVEDLNQQDDHHAACQGYHGSGHIGNHYIFGCASISATDTDHGGVLMAVYNPTTQEFTSRKIGYHDHLVDTRSGTFTYHPQRDYFIGNYDTSVNNRVVAMGFIRVGLNTTDFDNDDLLKPLNYTRCSFAQDLLYGYLVALANDGNLYIYRRPDDWSVLPVAVPLLPSFLCTGDQLHPDPRVAVDKGYAYVSSFNTTLNASVIYEVNLFTLQVRMIQLGVEVSSLVVVGVQADSCTIPATSQQVTSQSTQVTPTSQQTSQQPSSAASSSDSDEKSGTGILSAAFLLCAILISGF